MKDVIKLFNGKLVEVTKIVNADETGDDPFARCCFKRLLWRLNKNIESLTAPIYTPIWNLMSTRIDEFLRPWVVDHVAKWQVDTLRIMIDMAVGMSEDRLMFCGSQYSSEFLTRLYILTAFAVDPRLRDEMIIGAKKLLDDGPTNYHEIEKEFQDRIYEPTTTRELEHLMGRFPSYDEYKRLMEKYDNDAPDTKSEPADSNDAKVKTASDADGAYRCVSKGGHIVHLDPCEKVNWSSTKDAKKKHADDMEKARRRIYANSAYGDRCMTERMRQEVERRNDERIAHMKKTAARMRSKAASSKWVQELEKEQKEHLEEKERMRRVNEAFERMLEEDKSNACVHGGYSAESAESFIKMMDPEDRDLIESLIAFATKPPQLSCLYHPLDLEHELDELIKKHLF